MASANSVRTSDSTATKSSRTKAGTAATTVTTATTSGDATAAQAPAKRSRAPKAATATTAVVATEPESASTPAPAPSSVSEPTGEVAVATEEVVAPTAPTRITSEDVISVINASTLRLRNEINLAKSRKDKESVATLMDIIKQLNGIRKPIDRLARSKPHRKNPAVDANKNGLLKPVRISKDLADFLNCDENELKSRVQVTQAICKYIKEHDLQNPENHREIIVDQTLKDLLRLNQLGESPKLLYCDIQTHVKSHFMKTPPVEPAVVAPAA